MARQRHDLATGLLRQGDILLIPVDGLPTGAVPVARRGRLVLADGEATGHAHAVHERHARLFAAGPWTAASRSARYLVVDREPATLVHEEHDPIRVTPGAYRVLRQREYEPRARRNWRTVAD